MLIRQMSSEDASARSQRPPHSGPLDTGRWQGLVVPSGPLPGSRPSLGPVPHWVPSLTGSLTEPGYSWFFLWAAAEYANSC